MPNKNDFPMSEDVCRAIRLELLTPAGHQHHTNYLTAGIIRSNLQYTIPGWKVDMALAMMVEFGEIACTGHGDFKTYFLYKRPQ